MSVSKQTKEGKLQPQDQAVDENIPEYKRGEYPETPMSLRGLEEVEDKLTQTQKKVLDVILTDMEDDEYLPLGRLYKQLAGACHRAGMSGSASDRKRFYNTIKDPEFIDVVKRVGTGIIGMHIVPLVSKLIEMALEGNEKCLFKALKIGQVLPDKYSIFAHQAMIRGGDSLNVGELNIGNTPDKKIEGILDAIEHDEKEEIESSETASV